MVADKAPTNLLNTRIRERLNALGISEREASRRAEFSPGYVGDLLSGRSKSPEMARLVKLATALECDVSYLITGTGTVKPAASQVGSFAGRLIDLYASPPLSSGPWLPLEQRAVDKVPVIPSLQHVPDAYAYSVSTRHMEPRYFPGEVVYINPTMVSRPGDFVFAKSRDGRVGVAQLKAIEGGKIELSYLREGETQEVPLEDIEAMHRIVASAG